MSENSGNIQRLIDIMAKLRDPDGGCPWDVEQTFATIAPHTIEEAYEVADAIEQGDMAALKDELGDLLFQVVFHAQMASEKGDFRFEDVARAIADKMVRRHPHVFGDATMADAEAQTVAWEEHKRLEREAREIAKENAGNPCGAEKPDASAKSALDGVISALPALTRAQKLQKRAARVGFDWETVVPVAAKVREELAEVEAEINGGDSVRLKDEIGDLLFCCVNLARKLDIDPEQALRDGNAKFERRFRRMEALLADDGKKIDDLPVDEVLDVYWTRAKREE
ncbi:MAG: nucleoside triphosphate pyrophosphohydrolase [Rhodospirillaceae bacterium]|mgnify:FL=1|jgi:MazG family protein|nr:nucleoside triphosphate pyrophosphohydrolase [Rhodospirillaceae bacterium]|tara:strand:- start:323 stop:1168 length:846 start_codon:yes stop_codon:yes gene_type:complete